MISHQDLSPLFLSPYYSLHKQLLSPSSCLHLFAYLFRSCRLRWIILSTLVLICLLLTDGDLCVNVISLKGIEKRECLRLASVKVPDHRENSVKLVASQLCLQYLSIELLHSQLCVLLSDCAHLHNLFAIPLFLSMGLNFILEPL